MNMSQELKETGCPNSEFAMGDAVARAKAGCWMSCGESINDAGQITGYSFLSVIEGAF